MPQSYTVKALWDAEYRVWCASSADIPGLVAESETLEELIDEVMALVPALLSLNHATSGDDALLSIPVHVIAERDEHVVMPA